MYKNSEDRETFLDFLTPLDQYLGVWECGDGTYLIYRREDGWLEMLVTSGAPGRTLADVLHSGKRIHAPDGPVWSVFHVLDTSLMSVWLTEEEQAHFKYAIHVTTDRRLTAEAIERAMRQADPALLRRREHEAWMAAAPNGPTVSTDDSGLMKELLGRYEQRE